MEELAIPRAQVAARPQAHRSGFGTTIEGNTHSLELMSVEDTCANGPPKARVDEFVGELSALALDYLLERGVPPAGNRTLDWDNPATARFFDPHLRPAWHRWRKEHVPTAAALLPCQRPDLGTLADGTPCSTHEQELFRYLLDCVGLRTRAAIMRQLLTAHATFAQNGEPLRWLSLACGAAVPVLDAATHLHQAGGNVTITLADHDVAALRLAERLAAERGMTVRTSRVNVLRRHGLAVTLGVESQDVIDILGLFEYLQDEDWSYHYERVVDGSRRPLAGAVSFLRNAWALVRPGGLLVFGNMLETHPQLDFTLHVVQWPHIRPRSPQQIRHVVQQAGLPVASLRGYQAPDGVYGVYALVKPH